MNSRQSTRRDVLKLAGLATTSLAATGPLAEAQATVRRGLPPLKITDVKTILIQAEGEHLVIVKVLTSEPGLYGIGCATHGERPLAVAAAIDQHLKPTLIGKDCDRIEDIWQTSYVASYMYANDRPGLGIDIDEKLAARFPYRSPGRNRGTDRRLDGTIVRP